jgi:L-Ala-D/L-Glu epimerase / N-acetyl-D-glutamate racemase
LRLTTRVLRARFRAPFVFGSGSITARELLVVSLTGADGVTGWGEAAPLAPVGIGDVQAALEDCRGLLADSDGDSDRDQLLSACAHAAALPQALAAVDLALWDLAGRRTGLPVSRLLGAAAAPAVEVNATIAAADRAGAAAAAGAARAAGFRCVKVKVGLGDDAGRLAAVRAVLGPAVSIRLDANGVWSVEEAIAALRALEPVGIELCEEPVSGLAAIAELGSVTNVAVAIDESAAVPAARQTRVCDAICLKIVRCGGISGVLDAARHARGAGYEVYLASSLDGPLGIAAALHAAAAVKPERPCGLATLGLFDGPEDPLPAVAGRIAVPSGAGLGDGLAAWYGE